MSIGRWGRIVQVQMGMLMLAGHPMLRVEPLPDGDEFKLAAMREGLRTLRRITGMDYGYELGRWHEALLAAEASSDWSYRSWSDTWPRVKRAVERAMKSEERERLVQQLLAEDAAPASKPEA